MDENSKLVHGGGWRERRVVARPKAQCFTWLAWGWFVFAGLLYFALIMEAFGPGISSLPLLGWLLVLPQLVFTALAIYYWLTESPREGTKSVPNPDHEPRRLY